MFLAVDIGNSNIVVAVHNGSEWQASYRYESKEGQPEIFYESSLRDLLLEWQIEAGSISNAGISSVVPDLTEKISIAVKNNLRIDPVILSPELFISLDMEVPKVYEIGSDLVANAFAVQELYDKNTVIVDFGTALTFTVFEKGQGIKGVTIAPGLKTILSTLSNSTALLPNIRVEMPKTAIGKSTSTAINAGVFIGFTGLVKEILTRIKEELDVNYQVVATGGLSNVIDDLLPLYDDLNKNLTLEGIRLLANKKSA